MQKYYKSNCNCLYYNITHYSGNMITCIRQRKKLNELNKTK